MKTINVMFVLDETGSMDVVRSLTIQGFNEYLNSLRREKNVTYKFSLLQFNSHQQKLVHDAIRIKSVPNLNEDTYNPNYNTPLYDAIGKALVSLKGKKNVLFIIQTDGEENDSREFTRQQINDQIKERTEAGWQFVFMGSNQDAWVAGHELGLTRNQTLSYDPKDTSQAFLVMDVATKSYARDGGVVTTSFLKDKDTDIREKE